MEQQEYFLKITNGKIWFNQTDFIAIESTNIPYSALKFKTQIDIYWQVKVNSFDSITNKLYLSIINYNGNIQKMFINQKLNPEIQYLDFDKFDWKELDLLLTFHQKSEFVHMLINDDNLIMNDNNAPLKPKYYDSTNLKQILESEPKEIELNFNINFDDCTFMLGYVEFKKHIKQLDKELSFKIDNSFILPEFDNIKKWFARKLEIKKIKVEVVIEVQGEQVIAISATSSDIDRIDKNLIENIKTQRTLDITKPPKIRANYSRIFTIDDLYSIEDSSNIFKQSEKDILEILLTSNEIRNKKEIQYLSYTKQSLVQKIRFTTIKHFGFIFFVEGLSSNHFVWELLDSHATYIWSIEKQNEDIDNQYKRIESCINRVLEIGRIEYKKELINTPKPNALTFNLIQHSISKLAPMQAFDKWKNSVNNLLI